MRQNPRIGEDTRADGQQEPVDRPVAHWLTAFTLRARLLFFALLLAIPAISFVYLDFDRTLDSHALANRQLLGAQHVRLLSDVIVYTQQHRGLTNVVLSGDPRGIVLRRPVRAALEGAIDAVEEALVGEVGATIETEWRAVASALDALRRDEFSGNPPEVFAQHTAHVATLLGLIRRVSLEFELNRHSNAHVSTLVSLAVRDFVPWIELMGVTRGFGAGLIASGRVTADELARVSFLRETLVTTTGAIAMQNQMADAYGDGPLEGWAVAREAVDAFVASVDRTFDDHRVANDDAPRYFQGGTDAITAASTFRDRHLDDLGRRLAQEVADCRDRLLWLTAASALVGSLAMYLLVTLYVSTMCRFARIRRAMRRVAKGDLAIDARLGGRDELAVIAAKLNETVAAVRSLLDGVNEGAHEVATIGGRLANESDALTSSAIEQHRTLGKTHSLVRSLHSIAERNASDAEIARDQALQLVAQARSSRDSMTQVAASFASLQHSSGQMSDILSVIDGIALQTNLLALNASVEAARAGAAGRGFAIVAQEVGALAGRSAKAANDVKALIGTSLEGVAVSETLTAQAGSELSVLGRAIEEMADRFGDITKASGSQTLAVGEMTRAIESLGEQSRRHDHFVQHTQTYAAHLRTRADALVASTGHFVAKRSPQSAVDDR